MMLVTFLALLLGSLHVNADCYMHQPRGSNNRLNEKSANRNNANRMFDSQNNNRGGYNVGDLNDDAFNGGNPYRTNNDEARNFRDQYGYVANGVEDDAAGRNMQYDMMFLAGSQKEWAWTIQHGCGNAKNMCHMVLQWTCDSHDWLSGNLNGVAANANDKIGKHGIYTMLRNGGNTNTPNTAQKPGNNDNGGQVKQKIANRYAQNKNNQRGSHESEMWYAMGETRERNKGLFTADQKLNGNTMKFTRQNPGGTRRGLEVPEERDYYPHWRPSPWRDEAILTNDVEFCQKHIAPESQNVQQKWACISTGNNFPSTAQIKAKTKAECDAANGLWDGTSWKTVAGTAANLVTAPKCVKNEFSKVNHLGNVANSERGGKTASYMWTVPSIDTLKAFGCKIYNSGNTATEAGNVQAQYARIVTRLRYNMSSTDYDPYKTDASQNQNLKAGIVSPIQQNPTVDIGVHVQGLRLAINTAQTGRTFQDRSHVMTVVESTTASAKQVLGSKKILNMNVQGKRGNIVQTFPAVEYDFAPPFVQMKRGECLHFQWTGSNTHNNGNPAGDGQAGDAGEGTGGTDRNNVIATWDMRASYPLALDKTPPNGAKDLIEQSNCYDPLSGASVSSSKTGNGALSAQISLASSGFYESRANMVATSGNRALNNLLNNAGASYRRGLICCLKDTAPLGEYFLMNTRNNNHSNRSEKLKVVATL